MKKSLLAVAIAAALPAFAQAQSSITLYGVADVGVEYSNDDANTLAAATTRGDSGVRLRDGTQTPSRFGIRGVEDLGGGLRAVFNIENRFNIDTGFTSGGADAANSVNGAGIGTGSDRFWNGIAIVGLEGGWGRLTFGRNYTPIFYAIQGNDYSSYTMYNNWAGYTIAPVATAIATGVGGSAAATGGSVQGPIRSDNQIQYRSPTFGGLTLWATYAPGEALTAVAPASGDLFGVALGWQLGGLYIAGGYHSFDVATPTAATATTLEDLYVITAGYRFSSFGVSVGYSQLNFAAAAGSPSINTIFGSAFLNLGRGQLIANVYNVETDAFAAATGVRNDTGLQYGISYLLPLSKRTSTYITYGQNDYTPGNSALVLDSATRVAVGIRHNF